MQKKLDALYHEIAVCQKCPLGLERTNPVRDSTNPCSAKVVFIGEAPGANEVKQGIPFAGEAGKKLSMYLEEAGLTREDVYITNVVRCRPTANGGKRNRTPGKEIPICGGWLKNELEIIQPKTVVTLGNTALKWLCGKEFSIGDWHARIIPMNGFAIFPMYHPAAAIYNRSLDGIIRSEFQELGLYLGSLL